MSPIYLQIRPLRESAGMSIRALAEAAGTSPTTIVNIERGDAKRIDFAVLEGIADALGVHVSSLLIHERRFT